MPYIRQERREQIGLQLLLPEDVGPGDLNYIFSLVINQYMKTRGLKYATISSVVSSLECCKQEFLTRVARPYEDSKILDNGDVYDDEFIGIDARLRSIG